MERFFKLKERGTNIKTEIIDGMTTFFSRGGEFLCLRESGFL